MQWLPSRGRLLLVALGFASYVAALVFAARRWELPALSERAVAWLALALAFELGAKVLMALLFQDDLERAGTRISLRAALKAALVGSGASRVLPAGGALAPSAMGWAAKVDADNAAGAALRSSMLTYGGLVGLTGGVVLWGAQTGSQPILFAWQLVAGAAMLGVGVAILAGGRLLPWLVARLPRRLRHHFEVTVSDDRTAVKEILLVVARVATEAAVLWSALQAFGIRLSPTQTMVAYGVSTVVGGLPGLPGGLGAIEGGLVGVLTTYGYAAGSLVVPVLVYRIVDYWIIAGLGVAATGWVVRQQARTDLVIDLRDGGTGRPDPAAEH